MTAVTASGNRPLAAHVRLIRAAADLIEQAGIAGLAVWPDPGEIVIHVPGASGDAPSRAARVARLDALTGCEPAPDQQPGRTQGRIHARGTFAGHPVHIFTPFSQEAAS
ncbi:MAG: hypothetical protein ACYCVZ_00175 [Streptosporangiaceae bacterium]